MWECGIKLPWYFNLVKEKPLGHYFQVPSLYYQEARCNQKTPFFVSSRWQVNLSKNKVIFNFNQLHRKSLNSINPTVKTRYFYQDTITRRWGGGGSTKAKEASSPHKNDPTGYQPSILMS